ncbi:hypothetical protein NHX12_004602 [Muraenolepis orangiensis]|uniref:Uncharacterized protein n=1 Tax=Muraenolepis orangiensis TaxID=630683 RepID=A0A9Q0DVT5_9TELE|nr:hypothetical protein NHX12_004602 [Muraenolepis orangiensis]
MWACRGSVPPEIKPGHSARSALTRYRIGLRLTADRGGAGWLGGGGYTSGQMFDGRRKVTPSIDALGRTEGVNTGQKGKAYLQSEAPPALHLLKHLMERNTSLISLVLREFRESVRPSVPQGWSSERASKLSSHGATEV